MTYLYQKQVENLIHVFLTEEAFETFGQIWAIIPSSDRKRNFKPGEQIMAVEGSDGLESIVAEFSINRLTFNGQALERPDELTCNTPLFYAEAA